MLFVPLPLFATLFLLLLVCRILVTRDMTLRAHQLFASLIAIYAVQSLLVSLRWGYDIDGLSTYLVLLAPVLPAVAYMSYAALAQRQKLQNLWPVGVIALNWLAFAALPVIPDPLILMTYLGFGCLLLRLWWKGTDALSLSSINDEREIRLAMVLTGAALVLSGLTDIYLIFDFIQNDGRNAGLILTVVQTAFVVVIGVSASFGRAADMTEPENEPVLCVNSLLSGAESGDYALFQCCLRAHFSMRPSAQPNRAALMDPVSELANRGSRRTVTFSCQ